MDLVFKGSKRSKPEESKLFDAEEISLYPKSSNVGGVHQESNETLSSCVSTGDSSRARAKLIRVYLDITREIHETRRRAIVPRLRYGQCAHTRMHASTITSRVSMLESRAANSIRNAGPKIMQVSMLRLGTRDVSNGVIRVVARKWRTSLRE